METRFKEELYKEFNYQYKQIIDVLVEQAIREGIEDSSIIYEWIIDEVGTYENEIKM